ncbi:DUF6083 domain-containing protein [Streptomyces sp. AS58]|uniref:DUF6083 domain-containing protein n=1 Tax=Streptomyces sp. AS58 TaxID=1519489 RepID=UPI000D14A990|nr:DUF6083 domain-containing protein [Streptomyces sp. AS58]
MCRRPLVAGCTCRVMFRLAAARLPQGFRLVRALRPDRRADDSHSMGVLDEKPRRLGGGQPCCPYCGLLQDRVATLDQDWVLLEPDMHPLAHTVPAEHRWIELSDGRVTVYGVCPPDQSQRCRVEHRLACPAQPLPDLWPWLTSLRGENARRAERQDDPGPPPPPEEWPDAG